jgi:hypothetical protein
MKWCYTRQHSGMANTGQPRIIRFGSFEVDPAAGELQGSPT